MSAVAAGRIRDGSALDDRTGGQAATRWLARRWLRRRWLAMLPVLFIVIVGTTATSVALATAEHTSSAYREYLERNDVGDVVINQSVSTREIDAVIRSLPNVERVTTDVIYIVTSDDGAPRARRDVEADDGSSVTVHGSHDGRYIDMDRPAVQSGRMPTGRHEAVVTVETAAAEGVAIGDVIPLAFWREPPTAWRVTSSRRSRAR